MVGVRSLSDGPKLIEHLEPIGYECRGEAGLPGRLFFRKFTDGRRTHHLHLVEIGTDFWNDHILFRDHLRAHPETAHEYAQLKLGLAARFRHDRNAYTDGKDGFVACVLRRAREGGERVNKTR